MLDGQIITQGIAEGFAKGDEAHVPYLEGGNSYEASLFPHRRRRTGSGDRPRRRSGQGRGGLWRRAGRRGGARAHHRHHDHRARPLPRPPDGQAGPCRSSSTTSPTCRPRRAPTSYGAAHGSEVTYVFDNLPMRRSATAAAPSRPRRPTTRRSPTPCTPTGSPSPRPAIPGSAGGPAWPRYTTGGDRLLEFGADGVNVRTDFDKDRLDLIEQGRKPPAG